MKDLCENGSLARSDRIRPPSRAHPLAWRSVLLVFAVALACRIGWGCYRLHASGVGALEFPDEQQYWLMATSLHDGTGLRDELGFRAGRLPLYPALLSLAAGEPSGVAIAKVVQWVIGALGAVAALTLGMRIGGRTVGLFGGLLFAVDPFLVFFSNLLLTETLFITLLVTLWACGAAWLAPRSNPTVRAWLGIGALALACTYARESTLGLIVVALALYLARSRFRRSACVGIMLVAGVMVAGLFPWALRNHRVLGEWRWLTTRAGISLYDGVGPQATGASDLGDVKDHPTVRGLNELERNRYFLDRAWAQMRSDPRRLLGLAARKFVRMWNPVPNAADYRSGLVRLVSAAWMVPLGLLALVGIGVTARSPSAGGGAAVVYLLLPALYLSGLHVLFVGSVRYRLGAMPMLAVLAAIALERLLRGGVKLDARHD
jgi:hypothetical protein